MNRLGQILNPNVRAAGQVRRRTRHFQDAGKVNVTIINGTTSFGQGINFVFSVFKSVLGKTNITQNVGTSTIPPIGDNF